VTVAASQPAPLNRAARTRLALINAGRRLFAAHPIEGVTIDEIVQAAAVSKGSFYTYFNDRDALVAAITRDIRTSVERAVAAANADVCDPARRITRAVCVYLRFAVDEREQAGVLCRMQGVHTSLSAPLNHGVVEDVTSGLAAGRLALATVESGVLFVLGVAQIALVRTLQEPATGIAVMIAQQMCALLLRGFGLAQAEAEAIAAQAADEIVRTGAFVRPGTAI
jgi:AcrR family transcriptional regulator